MIRGIESQFGGLMKNELVQSFIKGFKDSFCLAACLFVAVASVIAAFANRDLCAKEKIQDVRTSDN
jgi:hypothetical protein